MSAVTVSNGLRKGVEPRRCDPSLSATLTDALFAGLMTWMTSIQPRFSNAQSIHRAAASVAYPFPHADRSRAQPTSVPGHPSGCHGPARPIHRPVAFSMIEKLLKPLTIQAPVNTQMFRHAADRHCGPPRKRVATGSATILAQDSKSTGC